jgi:hypothetical protein
MDEWENDMMGGPSQQFTKSGFKAVGESVSVSVTVNSNDKLGTKTKTSSGEDKNESVVTSVESKNNKLKKNDSKKKYLVRKPIWRRKFDSIVKQDHKAEHLMSGSSVTSVPQTYCIKGTDSKGQVCYSTVLPTRNVLVACRHGVSGMKKLELIIHGEEYEINEDKAVISDRFIDQVYIPNQAKKGMQRLPIANNHYEFEAPKPKDEAVFFFSLKDGKQYHVIGTVGELKHIVHKVNGQEVKIPVYEWIGSSVNGSCGGVFINKRGAIIGFHGVGSPGSKVTPMFYPCDERWGTDVTSVMTADNIKYQFGSEEGYMEKFTKLLNPNPELPITVEDLKSLNLPGRQN